MHERYNPDKGEWVTVQGGRSPSPEPIYDRNGRRSNTRDLRLRDRLQKERLALVEKMMTLQPATAALGQIKFQTTKKSTKLFVPIKEYPGYPFIGLILGPRGNTQKKLERETGTKIVIRGKGSVKDGKKGKSEDTGENEDLHVLITGDTQEQVRCLLSDRNFHLNNLARYMFVTLCRKLKVIQIYTAGGCCGKSYTGTVDAERRLGE